VNIWGTADPGEKVTVSFAGQKKSAVADASDRWQAELDPMPPSMEPRVLSVVSQVSNFKFQVSNVTIGEVWLATGQSNMVMPLRNTDHGPDRLQKTIPEIRFVKVPQTAGLPPVENRFTAEDLKWNTFEPGSNEKIAAVAFYFAEKVQAETGRQVGIIQSSYGGTPCQAWTPAQALNVHPELKHYTDAVRKALSAGKTEQEWIDDANALRKWKADLEEWKKTKKGPFPKNPGPPYPGNPVSQRTATTLYENMITPLIPYTARGVIWYQGEANAGAADEYRILFPAMIESWRTVWNRPDWPFYFVQLAAYDRNGQDWTAIRAAQTFSRDTVEHTGMALAIDCGDKTNIHPHRKQPVGERLARLALADVYGKNIAARGPAFQTLEKMNGTLRVVFQYSEKGLKTSDGKTEVPGFEAAGNDGAFHPVDADIVSDDTIELTGLSGDDPATVRYGWANFPEPPLTLQNSAGLPAEPFLHHLK
jgi:sialate O-acetylesterase